MGLHPDPARLSNERRSAPERLLVLATFLTRTAGKQAAQSVLTLYLTIGISAVILFWGNGLDAKLVTGLALDRGIVRVTLLAAWVVASSPFARAWLTDPQVVFLRALPVPNAALLGVLGLGSCIAQLPWFVLWLRGAGIATALAATAAALALQTAWVAGVRGALDAALGALAALWLIHPTPLLAPIAGCVFARALARAWARSGEGESRGRHWVVTRNPPLALASALGVALYRSHPPRFVRVAAIALVACSFAVLALLNNAVLDAERVAGIAMVFWSPACIFGTASLAGPLLRVEQRLGWVLASSGASKALRRGAAAIVLALPALLAGGGFAVAIAISLESGAKDALLLALDLGSAGAAWAAIGLALARATLRSTGRDSGRLLVSWALVYGASLALVLIPRALSATLLLVVAALVTFLPGPERRNVPC